MLKDNALYEKVKERVEGFLAKIREAYADKKLTPAEITELACQVAKEANGIVEDIKAEEGDREQLFVDICVACWQDLGKPRRIIPNLSWIPGDWIEQGLEEKVVDPLCENGIEYGAAVAYRLLAKLN